MNTMESTSPKETRVLDRFSACLVCRRRKLRCDGAQPECKRCHATGYTCQYQDPVYRSRTRVLQDRIKEIESKIEEIQLQRARSSILSQTSSPSGGNESASVDVLPPQSITQSTSPPATPAPNESINPTLESSSYSTPGNPWFEPGVLARRGPLDLSLPGEASKKFLNMFMQRKAISGFELHVGRVIRSFQPGSPDAPVPALFYAMLLLILN
ncbi:unnamed protein product [Rhizoctonia solani]|uniref:Zn(2)-C6 fungal-type domain-containing protein n=1 Tax=Rhizoctonia solani TaxID=456999 RepID=A0A8H2ZU65_9AGAM|nr:unnamed protein product [Rhizoctonia solani]